MISVIIPAVNEADTIGRLIEHLFEHANDAVEVILVDGGSSDSTVEIAEKAGAKVIRSPEKGRAKQMNLGAKSATYDLLYFLHADTYPPTDFIVRITESIENGAVAGCFRLSFDSDHPILKFYCWFTRFDVDVFRFGDQSLFVKKKVFENAGCFDESLIVMEDQEIVRAIKKEGKFNILNNSVVTSARKYHKIGVIKLQLIFTSVLIMYYLGVDQHNIVDFYFRKIR